MFPYPSGDGLHVGHPRGYIGSDIYARYKKMKGANILHPMGWDAFGLPAENYAIANKIHPEVAVKKNIKRFKAQLEKLGFNYDWEREINTTDPEYYKWTQWIFLQMFKKGLAYQSNEPINWCPSCKTGLANEDLEDGRCERCGSVIEKKPIRQWVLKITDYAERLLKDLEGLNWPEHIKESQRNWIGKSEGATIKFKIQNAKSKTTDQNAKLEEVEIFTTRPDTIDGATYLVVAPEHPFVKEAQNAKRKVQNLVEVEKYLNEVKTKSEIERTAEKGEKTGVELKGVKAINPWNGEEIPVWVADYVLGHYGTGAIMAVPAHDERDRQFAEKFKLPIVDRPLIDSGKVIQKLGAKKTVRYKLRDWVFSRQRYWGEPIPLLFCMACKKEAEKVKDQRSKVKMSEGERINPGWVPVPEEELPLKLPKVKSYEPTGTGESPLAGIDKWVNVKCPVCGGPAKRETNTMPQWAGSSWYYLAYAMKSVKSLKSVKSIKSPESDYWLPVDMYVGGTEHATRHLIYARFWHKFLYDIGIVSNPEPFMRLRNQGLILAEDGRKMSKRWGNVINPDEIVERFGADSLRLYEMFMGPFGDAIAWSSDSLVGMRRFIEKVWRLQSKVHQVHKVESTAETLLHQTIKKVGEDIENFKFNTAISSLMILVNAMSDLPAVPVPHFLTLTKLLAPFTPHLAEELWRANSQNGSIHQSDWPAYDESKVIESKVTMVVAVNGKMRDTFLIASGMSKDEVEEKSSQREAVKRWLSGAVLVKVIYVPDKLINFVLTEKA